jgi:hypothetical protein
MASLFDDRPMGLECPVCRGKFTKKIRGLRKANVTCPKCGVLFDTTALRASFDKAERVLGKLQRQLKDIEISFSE